MNQRRVTAPVEPRIVCPEDPRYTLPVSVFDMNSLTPRDEELISAMAMYAPKGKIKAEDICELRFVPMGLKRRFAVLPRFWKVRFVISAWSYEAMLAAMQHGGEIGMDRLFAIINDQRGFTEDQYRTPVIYAHGHPHGRNPGTAVWLPERALRKTVIRESNASWQGIIEDAGARYMGYDVDKMPMTYAFSVSPDNYSDGANIGRPFQHEEATVETMHMLGLGELYEVPLIVHGKKTSARIEADHEVYCD